MTDLIIESIKTGRLNSKNISFTKIRRLAGRDTPGIWNELGRGRKILQTYDQLDQYLHTYGPMTYGQWKPMLDRLSFTPQPIQIVDYGCGQGLATALFFDYTNINTINNVNRVILIEPSALALKRAHSIVSCYSSKIDILSINKKLDDLVAEDLAGDNDASTFHLFSNIMDIDSFAHLSLLNKILSAKGSHTVLAVSPDRNFKGGTDRITQLKDAVNDPIYHKQLTVNKSELYRFAWNNKDAISMLLDVEVKHGSI